MFSGGSMTVQQAAAHASWNHDSLAEHLLACEKPERVIVSNVAGNAIAKLMSDAVRGEWSIECEFVRPTREAAGVRNGYANPEQIGVDRWMCLLATHDRYRSAACIVSVGTAMTLDALA